MTALCKEKSCTLPEVQALAGDVRPVFLRVMSGAAEALRDIMKARGLCYAEAEAPLSGMLSDTPPVACEGRLDLRFTDSKGKNVILDMKWTKASTRYGDLLEKDQDTQLAAYAGLDGNTTDAGYFLLRNGHVLWHEAHSSLTKRWQTIHTKVSSILQDWEQGILDIKRTEDACTYCELRILCGENV
ncbi:MAG: PD-(D/E)XK nuclease family protein [Bilophila sp.]